MITSYHFQITSFVYHKFVNKAGKSPFSSLGYIAFCVISHPNHSYLMAKQIELTSSRGNHSNILASLFPQTLILIQIKGCTSVNTWFSGSAITTVGLFMCWESGTHLSISVNQDLQFSLSEVNMCAEMKHVQLAMVQHFTYTWISDQHFIRNDGYLCILPERNVSSSRIRKPRFQALCEYARYSKAVENLISCHQGTLNKKQL